MNFSKDSEFNPQDVVDWAKKEAEKLAPEMDYDSAVQAMRSVVEAFIQKGILDIDSLKESPTAPFEAAAQTLYVCHLIPLLFPVAYAVAEKHTEIEHKIEDGKDDVIQSLYRSFDL